MRKSRGPTWAPREGRRDGDVAGDPVRALVLRRHLKAENFLDVRKVGGGALWPFYGAIGIPGGHGWPISLTAEFSVDALARSLWTYRPCPALICSYDAKERFRPACS